MGTAATTAVEQQHFYRMLVGSERGTSVSGRRYSRSERNVLPPFPRLLFLNLFSGEDSHTVFTQLVLFFLGLIPASAFNGLS